ncbi:MAG: IS200/IS605 family transposase [Bacteroidetes bacterium]|nr:IS200/IS605 family transposase [Bacteroidota bacterium]
MSYVKIWLHCVWGTKRRIPYLTNDLLKELTEHIKVNALEKGIYIDTINGHREHIHSIISLGPDQAIARVIQLIKGESSFWINRNKLTVNKFEWADEYYAASFGDSDLDRIRLYIRNQELHHTQKTWDKECNEMIKKDGLVRIPGPPPHPRG